MSYGLCTRNYSGRYDKNLATFSLDLDDDETIILLLIYMVVHSFQSQDVGQDSLPKRLLCTTLKDTPQSIR